MRPPRTCSSALKMPAAKRGPQQISLWKRKITCPGQQLFPNWPIPCTDVCDRVEKYRPNTLDDVSGHQDILATINRFVESNVYMPSRNFSDTHLCMC